MTNVYQAQSGVGIPFSFDDENTFGAEADVQSDRRSPAKIAIVVASVLVLLAVIVLFGTLLASVFLSGASTSYECSQLGSGTHQVAGTTYVCSSGGNTAHSNGG